MAILRSIGAKPYHVFGLLMTEAISLVVAGIVMGVLIVYSILFFGRPVIEESTGLYLELNFIETTEISLLAGIMVGGVIASVFPAIRAYKMSLSDGLIIRI